MEMMRSAGPLEELSIISPFVSKDDSNPLDATSSGEENTDWLLVQQTLAGDQKGFERVIHRYSRALFRFIYHFLGDYDQACDVLQQVFVQLYLALPTLQGKQSFKPWLFRVAHNYCIDAFRRRRRRLTYSFSELSCSSEENEAALLDMFLDTNPLPEEVAEMHDMQRQIMQAISPLPSKYRSIVLLRYAAQLSFEEIGQILGIPMATVKIYFYRAKSRLQAALEKTL
jgi:RNA polymerase sigma-70 factor, ECF subfamily